ncbi:MAG: RNA polymerase sigma-70 factor [Chitinophagaceae bacterium]|nr:RNA polymerase sigma-70 factor [Chitinophagaceae bacterium]
MEGFSTLEERALLSRVADGNEKAFTQLFERYSDVAYGFAIFYTKTAESAEEVVQEIFLKLWLKREKLREIQSFPDHLFIITRNHIIDFLRKHLREKKYQQQLMQHFREVSFTPEQQLIFKESGEIVEKAVAMLPPQQQTIYRLRRNEDMPLDEIAFAMNLSRLTVRNHLNKALGTIRAYLRAHSGELVSLLAWIAAVEKLRR